MPCRASGCCIAEEPLAGLVKGSDRTPQDLRTSGPDQLCFAVCRARGSCRAGVIGFDLISGRLL